MKRDFAPEVEIMLLCAQPVRTDVDADRMRELAAAAFNWQLLFQLSRRHSLLPLAYQRLQPVYESIPVDVLQKLRLAYQENVARNLIFADELVQITQALDNAGIDSIAYKGPLLAKIAYGDVALRRFIDLDVMVRRADVLQAAQVLTERGYVASKDLTDEQQAMLLSSQHNLQFTSDSRRLLVELHWQVSSHLFAASVTAEELWKNLETAKLNGVALQTFAPDDLLFSLCVHGSRHLWERLAWIADIAHLLKGQPEIDWNTLLKRAKQAQAERMFLLGVHLAVLLLRAPVPAHVQKTIDGDRQIKALAMRIIFRLFDGPEHRPATAAQILKYNWGVRSGWRSRLRYMLFTLEPTEGDVGSLTLPPGMGFAYYLLRPFRLLVKGSPNTNSSADA